MGGYFGDDLDMLLAARAQAQAESASEFEMHARMRDHLASGAPLTNGLAAIPLFGSLGKGKGILGNVARVTISTGVQPVVFWTADSDQDAIPITVTLGLGDIDPDGNLSLVANTNPPSASWNTRAYASLQWGTRGFPAQATCDVGKGCQFSVGGSFLTIGVGIRSPTGLSPPTFTITTPISVGAMLSAFRSAGSAPITSTVYIDNLGNGSSFNAIVPNFAKRLLPMQSSPSGTMTLLFLDLANNVLATYPITSSTSMTTAIPLANDCYFVNVQNTSGAPITTRCVFELSL